VPDEGIATPCPPEVPKFAGPSVNTCGAPGTKIGAEGLLLSPCCFLRGVAYYLELVHCRPEEKRWARACGSQIARTYA